MKKVVSLLMLAVLTLSLMGCTVAKEDVVGTWAGTWEYNGNSFAKAFVLSEDNTYEAVFYKNGDFHEAETGIYEIDGRTVTLYPNGDKDMGTPYDYENGNLVNADHAFTKE